MPVMICFACGASNRPTARFWEECGLSGLPCCGACAQAAWCLLDTSDAAGSLEFPRPRRPRGRGCGAPLHATGHLEAGLRMAGDLAMKPLAERCRQSLDQLR